MNIQKIVKSTLIVGGLLLAGNTAYAQAEVQDAKPRREMRDRNMNPEKMAKKSAERMGENLGLNETQVASVEKTLVQFAADRKAASEDKTKMKAAATARDASFKAIFTTEQYAKYEKNKEEMGDKMKDKAKQRKDKKDDGK